MLIIGGDKTILEPLDSAVVKAAGSGEECLAIMLNTFDLMHGIDKPFKKRKICRDSELTDQKIKP